MIYADVTGFGDAGPDAALPGFDLTAYWARSGLLSSTRDAGAPPTVPIPGSGDYPTAMSLYAAIATALYHRERTGQGMSVGTSLLATGVWSAGIVRRGRARRRQVVRTAQPGRTDEPADQPLPVRGRSLVHARRLAAALAGARGRGRVSLAAQGPALRRRGEHRAQLGDADRAARHRVPLAAARPLARGARPRAHHLRRDPDARGSGRGPAAASERRGRPAPRRRRSRRDDQQPDHPARIPQDARAERAPALGEHNDEVLGELGFDRAAIARLRAAGAIPATARAEAA